MIDSLSEDQIEHIVKLGKWRDEGHLLAVGLDGKVSIHPADKGDCHVATEQREGAARRQGPSGGQGAAGSSGAAGQSRPAAPPEPAREDGIADVRQSYLASMPEIREYYPDLRVIEVEDGIWVVTQIFPIGRDGPFFTVCLFLHDSKAFDPKAFAFKSDGRSGVPVGPRHTNFSDASICSHSSDDPVWAPDWSPLVLLNLYAEWLLCQLFLAVEAGGYWPGRQVGLNATYRELEFLPSEWCDCGRGGRYGECHRERDKEEVRKLKISGRYQPLPSRSVPLSIVNFARSGWRKPVAGIKLELKRYEDPSAAAFAMLQRNLRR